MPKILANIWMPSVLWRCWLGGRKGIRPVKNWVVGCWRGCLGWGADLNIAQQMPLPLTISCSSKSRLVLNFLVLPFWYLLTRVDPGSKAVKRLCVCVEFWSPQLHQRLRLHSTCHLNNGTYPITPDLHWHQYLHLCILYQLLDSCNVYKQMSSSLCTCYPLYHYISCVPTSGN